MSLASPTAEPFSPARAALAGHRNTDANSGALGAAEAIEKALAAIRLQTAHNTDAGVGRVLIERLRTDPGASL